MSSLTREAVAEEVECPLAEAEVVEYRTVNFAAVAKAVDHLHHIHPCFRLPPMGQVHHDSAAATEVHCLPVEVVGERCCIHPRSRRLVLDLSMELGRRMVAGGSGSMVQGHLLGHAAKVEHSLDRRHCHPELHHHSRSV